MSTCRHYKQKKKAISGYFTNTDEMSTLYVWDKQEKCTRGTEEQANEKMIRCAVVSSKNLSLVLRNENLSETNLCNTTHTYQNLGGDRPPDALKGPVEPNGSASSKESNRPKFLELLDESNPATFSPLELLMESNLEKRVS